MENELKHAIKLMKSNKEYKAMFGWHPVCYVVYVVTAIITGGGFIIDKLMGEASTTGEQFFFSVFPAFFFWMFGIYFGNQGSAMLSCGKSLLSFPAAKYVLTKGLVVSRMVSFAVGILPAVAMRLLCVALGLCEVSLLDDMLISFAITYVLGMITTGYAWISSVVMMVFGINAVILAVGNEVLGGSLGFVADAAVEYVMPWWLVTIVFVGLIVLGTWLGLVILEHTYKKRRVACTTLNLRVAQR